MRINHNVSAMITQGSLFKTNRDMGKSIEKLSTGLRINSAADDAAGLGVSENLRTQVRGMGQAMKNTQDAISLLNIADGALNEMTDILQRMRELIIQGRNDTYTSIERSYMGTEFSSLMEELDRVSAATNYNGMMLFANPMKETGTTVYPSNAGVGNTPHQVGPANLLFTDAGALAMGPTDHGSSHHFDMMIGANYTAADAAAMNGYEAFEPTAENLMTIQLTQMDTNALFGQWPDAGMVGADMINTVGQTAFGFDPLVAVTNPAGDIEDGWINDYTTMFLGRPANIQDKFDLIMSMVTGKDDTGTYTSFMGTFENPMGLERVNKMRAYIGAMTNRLEHTVNNSMNQIAAQQSAESSIRDTDFAAATATFTKNQILTQSATAMLSQANSAPQGVLSLLR